MTRIGKPTGSSLPIVGLLALGLVACGGKSEAASRAGAVAKTAVTASGLTIDVVSTQSWSGGFNGAVRITDTSFASPVTSFQIVFKLAGGSVVGTGWNGTITGPDASGNYTAKNPDWLQYGPIRAGSSWDVGFNGSGALSGSTIVSLTVNGQAIPLGGDSPPTVSLAGSGSPVVGGTFTLTATAADDHGVSKVEFYDGTTLLATDTAAPYTCVVPVTSAGSHTYGAKAYDTIDQTATATLPVTFLPVDLPPTVSLASNAVSPVTVAGTFTLTATAGDDHGVTKVEFYDGTTLLATDTAAPYTFQVNATAAINGTHGYTAKAYDGVNPATTSGAVTVVINIGNQGPSVSLSASSGNVTAPGCITLTAPVTDTNTVVKVDFYEGTTLLGTDTTAPYTWQICYTAASNGTHVYTAKATDSASLTAVSPAVTVVVNIVPDAPPSVSLASTATSVTAPTTITLTATATDDHGVTRVEFYDGTTLLGTDTTAPYTQSVSFTASNNGTHVMTARAYDTASQSTTSTAVNVVVSIDSTPPTCSLSASSSNVTAPGSITLTATATDNVGVTRVEFYEGTTLLGTDTASPYTLVLSFTAANNGTHVYGCKAYDAAGNVSPPMTGIPVAVNIQTNPADVTLTVDASASRRAISPYVYGYNASRLADAPPGATYLRIGGNRWTAYNWTNNYSNAGADWGPYSNDTFLGTPAQGPGAAITPTIDDAKANGIAAVVTIPIQGYVSQAKTGNVLLTDPVTSWFVPNVPAKGSAFTLTPSASSTTVYQDELANFIANRWGSGATPHISLDNEPDLWGYLDASGNPQGTHPEIQRTQLTYAAFLQKSIASATAIKAAVPNALVYGPVSYGWNGFLSFQSAPDSTGATIDNSFLDYYLTSMAAASTSRRLLDVLDVHWYSEATSNGCSPSGVRVTAADNSDCVVAARVQAPRSLFDPTYVETSWITQWTTASSAMGAGIQLLPRLEAKISSKFPGTKLSVTEYNHGGEDHVSGAVAEADTLGILGREGAYAAAFWSINSNHTWAYAAWKAFRNYDGSGHNFGDTSVSASTTDISHVSVYASVDAANANRMVLVVVHRPTLGSSGTLDLKSRTVQLNWTNSTALRTARAWQLASASSPTWQSVTVPAPTSNSITLTLPALSVTTVELTP